MEQGEKSQVQEGSPGMDSASTGAGAASEQGAEHSFFDGRAGRLGHQAREGVQQFRERVGIYQEGATEFLDSLALYIKENPQRAAIIAGVSGLGLGLLLGLLVRPRN